MKNKDNIRLVIVMPKRKQDRKAARVLQEILDLSTEMWLDKPHLYWGATDVEVIYPLYERIMHPERFGSNGSRREHYSNWVLGC